MFQYDLILCQSVFAQYIRVVMAWEGEYEANAMLKAVINQHNIVLSDKILTAYENAFDRDIGLQDVFMNFICNEAYIKSGRFKMVLDEQESPENHDDLLIAISKNDTLEKPYVVCGECDTQSQLEKKMRPAKPIYLSMFLQSNIYQNRRL